MSVRILAKEIYKYIDVELQEHWMSFVGSMNLDKVQQSSGYCRALDKLKARLPVLIEKAEQLTLSSNIPERMHTLLTPSSHKEVA